MNPFKRSSSVASKQKKWVDAAAVAGMALVWMLDSFLANAWWGAKKAPFVRLTWGHLTFSLLHIGLPILWFFVIRKYPLSYLGLIRPRRRLWYFVAPLGVAVTFGFGIPTYLLITKLFPILEGGGMAGTPPLLGYPLHIVLLVELFKYPLTAAIPHEVSYTGAVFHSVKALGKGWFAPAVLITAALYAAYHFPFDFSFSAVYFNLIITLVAVFLLRKSGSLIPAMIFHSAIVFFAIFASWGYYLGK
ncbi:MAG: CPBP family intramembrane metalloprotease [Anaerolineales bacterium]|nr:CPBP family intramembrane metalloprotease [Anaerolineales bacterium]